MLKPVPLVPREAEAFEALRKLDAQALSRGGLLDVQELQRRFRDEALEAADALPRNASDEATRAVLAAFALDVFVPKYSASMAAFSKA